mgnify:CR=1 FL=1
MGRVNYQVPGTSDWVSRSVAVSAVILTYTPGTRGPLKVLLQERGPGCPDYVGQWACTCGYLDYDEDLDEAIRREIREELGIPGSSVTLVVAGIQSDPRADARQNVTVRYVAYVPESEALSRFRAGPEVSRVTLIGPSDLPEVMAFNHRALIEAVLRNPDYWPGPVTLGYRGPDRGVTPEGLAWEIEWTPWGVGHVVFPELGTSKNLEFWDP